MDAGVASEQRIVVQQQLFLLFPIPNKLLHNNVIIIGVAFNTLSKDKGGSWVVAAAADG